MAASLREHEPGTVLTILLLDDDPLSVERIERVRLIGLEDVLGDAAGSVAVANPPGALALAALPALAGKLLEEGAESLMYIGAGQRILGPLAELEALLGKSSLVLVARVGAEHPDPLVAFEGDGARGAFSRELLGFRGGSATNALLSTWPRVFADAGDDGADAVRAWLERLPALSAGVAVLRDAGYGLDPWSLAQRDLGIGSAEALLAGERPVRMFDFSALDPYDPPSLFDGDNRIRLSSTATLGELAERQASEMLAAGFARDFPYAVPYTRLEDGLRLTTTLRTLALSALVEGAVTRSPFREAGRVQLYDFLNQPGERGRAAGLTRLHIAIWEARPALRSSYSHLDGPDGAGFAGWLCVHGIDQEGLVAELLPPTPEVAFRDSNPHVHEGEPRWGVNVAGFFTSELGVGEAARLLIAGLDAGGVPALPIQGNLLPSSRQGSDFAYSLPDEAAYPINIVCINGDGIPVFAREAGGSFFKDRYTIALWWWEVGEPPSSWREAYRFIDEVWVGSQHIYDAIASSSPVPVVRVTLPVIAPELAHRTRSQLGLPEDGFLFLYMHDYHSVAARKNPLGLIEAFKRAFAPGAGAKLVLKSINAELWPQEHERIRQAAGGHPDVELLDAYVSATEKNAMIAHCDCYVSLHRAEGFGLTVAEAMLLGKPVIATRFGGTLEFMNDANSYLVSWEPVLVGEGAYPYPPQGTWAEPDLNEAADLMRRVRAEPAQAAARGERARLDLLEQHSPMAAGRAMARRLSLIHERISDEGLRTLNLPHLPPAQDGKLIEAKIAGAPRIGWDGSRGGGVKEVVYRPVANWARAYAKHQSGVDAELYRAIASVDARLREVAATLQERQQAQHAETLALLRRFGSEIARLRSDRPDES
jgi:glycosyltransferase involved in cell wall biosynthesis